MLLLSAGPDRPKPPAANEPSEPPEVTSIIDRIIANELQMHNKMQEFSPRVETYLQYYKADAEIGESAISDDYFLGGLTFGKKGENKPVEESFLPDTRSEWLRRLPSMLQERVPMDQFAVESLVVDENSFDRQHYTFDPVRWEYLGDVRCLALDVHPRNPKAAGAFEGRIWVEDHDYAIVRLNGTRLNPRRWDYYTPFDCWRENLQPGLWLPVYIFSQVSDFRKHLRYRAETRLWGYDLTARHPQQDWTNILVEAPEPVRDSTDAASDMSPVQSERQVTMDAERNVLDRLEKARFIAPPGPVDKVLETVVNNLVVTNHLDNLPPLHCRVMLTSTLESFSLAYTIVLSRGLLDVLPDEASLATILAHELAKVASGQKLDAKYSFDHRMQIPDKELLAKLDVAREQRVEAMADARGIELLKNSPYKDQLSKAGLFLRAAAAVAPHVPCLFGPNLGNGLTAGKKGEIRMEALASDAPPLNPTKVDQIAALPLGSRIQVNAWDGTVAFTTRKAVPLVDASEKMYFRVTPVIPYLRLYSPSPKTVSTAAK
jgi:hypothetical protein